MQIIVNLSILGVVWCGGIEVIAGKFSVGDVFAFANYLLTSIMPLLFLAMMASQLSAAARAPNRELGRVLLRDDLAAVVKSRII